MTTKPTIDKSNLNYIKYGNNYQYFANNIANWQYYWNSKQSLNLLLKISNRIFFRSDGFAKSRQVGEKTGNQKTELVTRNPDSEIQMLTLTEIGGCYQRNKMIFIKKNYYFICIPLIYNSINNLDIK